MVPEPFRSAAGSPLLAGPATAGTITAGTDTTGGVLDLTGTGFITSPFVFAIGTAAPTTLEFDLAGGVVTSAAITINNVNQTLEIGPSGLIVHQRHQNVTNGTILMAGGRLTDCFGHLAWQRHIQRLAEWLRVVAARLTRSGSGTADTITATGGKLTLITTIGATRGWCSTSATAAASSLQLDTAPGTGNTFTFLGLEPAISR